MKNRILSLIILFFTISVFNSCTSLSKDKERENFVTQFFDNESVYNSLKDYYPQKNIVIYDEKKELLDTPKLFGINSEKIKLEITKPLDDNYFIVYSFNLNNSLASIVLATSDGDKGIIYYVEKKKQKWTVMNIITKNRY